MNYGTYSFPKKTYDFDMDTNGVVKMTASTSITKGDIVVSVPGGVIGIPGATTGPAPSQTLSTKVGITLIESVNTNSAGGAALLSNGNLVVAYGNSPSNIKFAIYNPQGSVVIAPTIVESLTSPAYGVSVAALTNGGFVVAYNNNATNVRFSIYTATGVLVGSRTTVEAVNSVCGVSVTGLSNGNFVVAYSNSTSSVKFGQYTYAGVLVGALTIVESVSAAGGLAVSSITNGNFVVAYGNSTTSIKFGQYTTANAIVGALTTVEAGSPSRVAVTGLPSGNFVVAYGNTTPSIKFGQYTTANAIVGSITTVEAGNLGSISVAPYGSSFLIAYSNISTGTSQYGVFATNNVLNGDIVTFDSVLGQFTSTVAVNSTSIAIVNTSTSANVRFIVLAQQRFGPNMMQLDSSPATQQYGIQTARSGVSTSYRPAVCGLLSGGFVAGWSQSNADGNFLIYNQFGNVQNTSTPIVLSGASAGTSLTSLPNGNFVFAGISASTGPVFSIYNSSGTLIVGPVSISGTPSIFNCISTVTLTNGNFVIAYARSGSVRFSQFNSAGILIGSDTAIEAVTASSVSVAALTNGNFVVAYTIATTAIKFAQYTTANVIVGSTTTIEAISPEASVAVTGLSNNNFVVVYGAQTTNVKFAQYNGSNIRVGSITVVEAASSNLYTASLLANGNFMLSYFASGVKYAIYTPSNAVATASTVVDPISSSAGSASTVLPNGNFVLLYVEGTNSIRFVQYTGITRAIHGVALNNATSGEQVSVRYLSPDYREGSFLLGTPTTFTGFTFDHRSVGGIAGTIAGNTLFSKGYTA